MNVPDFHDRPLAMPEEGYGKNKWMKYLRNELGKGEGRGWWEPPLGLSGYALSHVLICIFVKLYFNGERERERVCGRTAEDKKRKKKKGGSTCCSLPTWIQHIPTWLPRRHEMTSIRFSTTLSPPFIITLSFLQRENNTISLHIYSYTDTLI